MKRIKEEEEEGEGNESEGSMEGDKEGYIRAVQRLAASPDQESVFIANSFTGERTHTHTHTVHDYVQPYWPSLLVELI